MQDRRPQTGTQPAGIDIAYGRAPLAPEADRLRATARWNRNKAAGANKAAEYEDRRAREARNDFTAGKHRAAAADLRIDAVRCRLNAAECDTVRAELLLAAEQKEAA